MKRFITLLLFTVCATGISQNEFSITSLSKELTTGANSVLVDEFIEIDLTSKSKMHYKTRRVVAVLNDLGNDHLRTSIGYDAETRVKNIEAFVYDAFGNEIEHYRKKDFKDVSAADGISLYSDDRMLFLHHTPTTYPYFLVFESEVESTDSAFLPFWYPLGGYGRSTQKSVVKVKYDPTNKPKYYSLNLEGHEIEISDRENELVFSAKNLKAIRYEDHSPSFYLLAPNVSFALDNFQLKGVPGNGKNWEQFGKWMDDALLSDVNELSPATVATIKSLVANETTNEGKARKIYQYVQDKVRYISVQIGIGGWKPMPAMDVDKLAYGDCKALTNYTKTLLEVAGIPSYYTVLYAGDDKRNIKSDFTSMQGNHAILAIPNGDDITWLECTSQDTPFGYIGDFTDDREVLMITPEGGKIARTKAYSTSENRQENTAKIFLDTNGNITATFNSISGGLKYDEKYLLPKRKQEEVEKYYKNKWSYINGLNIGNIQFQNNREEVVFTENASVQIPGYANAVGNDFLFCVNIFNQSQYVPPRFLDRKQDLHIHQGYTDIDTLEINIPEGFSLEGLPENEKLETKFGSYNITFEKISDHKLVYQRELIINKGNHLKEEYENYRDFRRAITKGDKAKILIKNTIQ